jgi:DNA-directed RNA polymerase subunit K/omega
MLTAWRSGERPGFQDFFEIAFASPGGSLSRFVKSGELTLNAELVRKALDKVGNPNTLVGIVSRRVRQLNSGGGGLSRPLVADVGQAGAADIALREIIEEKIGWELPVLDTAPMEAKPKRKRK